MKHMKLYTKFLFLVTFVCSILVTSYNFSSVNAIGLSIKTGDFIKYRVTNSSNTENAFYGAWPPAHYFGNWSVNIGDIIMFTVTSTTNTSINGTIVLGNNTFVNVRNIDIASALAFSIYPWMGGLIANSSNWDNIDQQINNCNSSLTIDSNFSFTINSGDITTTIRKYTVNNYYGQYSEFYYDSETGVLLKGYSGFGNYLLAVQISDTNISIGEQITSQAGYYLSWTILSFIGISAIIIKNKHN